MKTNLWRLIIAASALLPACGDDTVEPQGKQDGATDRVVGKDTVPDLGPVGVGDLPIADLAADLAGPPDGVLPAEVGGIEVQVILDVSREHGSVEAGQVLEVQSDVGKPDVALPDVAPDVALPDVAPDVALPDVRPDVTGEAGPPRSYVCRTDSDCCIVIEWCMQSAHLYSKAPGASPAPSFPPELYTVCATCIPPAVQVRCDSGQCVGEKLSTVHSGPLIKDHCGPVDLPDSGAGLYYPPAYAGAQQTSWSCGP